MTGTIQRKSAKRMPRLRGRAALVGAAMVVGAGGLAEAQTRSLTFFNTHTQERTTVTYKRGNSYDAEGLKQLNFVLRDWRRDEQVRMDPELLDLIWEVYQETGATSPIAIVCGYRAPETNNMLRNRSRGVAKLSQHMLGKALDFYIPGVPLAKLREVGMKMQYGGVGFYPSSNFVHLDVGSVRAWPRMSREQLVRLFPDGRTLHQPAEGGSLSGYNLAMADFQRKHPSRQRADWAEDDEGLARPASSRDRVIASTSEGSATRISDAPAPPPAVATLDTGRGRPLPAPQPAAAAPAAAPAIAFNAPLPTPRPVMAAAPQPVVVDAPLPLAKPDQAALALAAAPRTRPLAADGPVLASAFAAPQARPSRSAMDAAAALAGDDVPASDRMLGYAPDATQPASRSMEATGSLAQGGFGRTVVAALPPSASVPSQSDNRAAPKASRADPMARLVSYVTERPDPALLVATGMDRAGGASNLRHPDQGSIAALMAKPQRVLYGGFGVEARIRTATFSGPAVVALGSVAIN